VVGHHLDVHQARQPGIRHSVVCHDTPPLLMDTFLDRVMTVIDLCSGMALSISSAECHPVSPCACSVAPSVDLFLGSGPRAPRPLTTVTELVC
jgi:hypothetical protein